MSGCTMEQLRDQEVNKVGKKERWLWEHQGLLIIYVIQCVVGVL